MLYPAANRDPRVYENPHRFDIHRRPGATPLSFGIGKHFCLGASLARLELRICVKAILKRFPKMTLNTEFKAERHPSSFVRRLTTCPVIYSEGEGAPEKDTMTAAESP